MIVPKTKLKDYLDINNITNVVQIDDTWKIEEIKNEFDYSSYLLTNTSTGYTYVFNGVFGLEQISKDEFIAFKRYGYMETYGVYCYELLRYHLNEYSISVSERLPEKYGWTPVDGDYSYTIVDVSHKRKKLTN